MSRGWELVVFFDDVWPKSRKIGNVPIAGDSNALASHVSDFDGVIVAIGDNQVRVRKTRYLTENGAALVSIIHPAASVSRKSTVGAGTVICAGAVVNVGARLGVGCIVNSNATVEHDCTLDDGVHVSPGANLGGNVTVGRYSWIGIGASVKNGLCIGRDVIVGGGSMVIDDVSDGSLVIGVPARLKE